MWAPGTATLPALRIGADGCGVIAASRQHGVYAEIEATRKADLMLERGDGDGQIVWMRIRRAIVASEKPGAD